MGEHLVVFMKMVLLHCGICGKGLQSGGYLKRHMRAVHEGMVPQCTICTIIYLYKKYKSSEVTISFIF